MKARLLSTLIIAVGLAAATEAQTGQPLPDSMLTGSKVREVMYDDRALAERIVSQMRQRKAASDYEIGKAQADIHYNYMEFSEAAAIYERLQDSREARADSEKMMDVLESLCDVYDAMHDLTKLQSCIRLLFDTATDTGNKYYQSIALYLMGKTLYYQGPDHQRTHDVSAAGTRGKGGHAG